ncbi:phage head closure protein [Gemella sp. 27098_8_92]|uniref:phage head closure protein n=1 Tax=Gemella sp. 27098_8_92 TaxID=3003687 RepID=UPI00352DBAAB
MSWNDEVILISEGKLVEDELGQQERKREELKVLCNEKSVGRFEFYQAARAGFKPQLILRIHRFENNNPIEVVFRGKKYSVIKEYTSDDITELTCEEIKNESR